MEICMKSKAALIGAALSAIALNAASAATLTLNLIVDNQFDVYLSNNNAVLGTLIGSGSDWPTTFTFSTPLTGSTNYYIQVVGTNWTTLNPGTPPFAPGSDNPDAFIGTFSITGGGFQFANGLQTISTDAVSWFGVPKLDNTTWTDPTGNLVQAFGPNGCCIWGANKPGPESNIDSGAQWIWSNPDNGRFADISTAISAVPEISTWVLMLLGFAGIGIVAYRRTKKASVEVAA
jgi:hypothetical protein